MRAARLVGCAMAAVLAVQTAHAGGRLLLAGVEKRRQGEHYAYVGALLPLPGDNRLGQGWVTRLWADSNRYGYEVSNPALYLRDPQPIDARARGLEAALGYHVTRGGLAVAGYAGLRYVDTRFTPEDPGSRVSGTQLWPKLQFELANDVSSRWRSRNIASYTFGLEHYWVRSHLVTTVGDGFELGPELVLMGDRDYRATKLGLTLGGLKPTADSSLALRAGRHFQQGASSFYVGLDFALDF